MQTSLYRKYSLTPRSDSLWGPRSWRSTEDEELRDKCPTCTGSGFIISRKETLTDTRKYRYFLENCKDCGGSGRTQEAGKPVTLEL